MGQHCGVLFLKRDDNLVWDGLAMKSVCLIYYKRKFPISLGKHVNFVGLAYSYNDLLCDLGNGEKTFSNRIQFLLII